MRVAANHPAYQLHTYLYSVPPNKDPHEAVRTGMDFLINMGDRWLSNTPRRGADSAAHHYAALRDQLCIACHPVAVHYARIFDGRRKWLSANPAPCAGIPHRSYLQQHAALYGEPNTNWVRVIYTARTVASRLPLIAHAFEQNVTHDAPRKKFDVPYAEFPEDPLQRRNHDARRRGRRLRA